MTVEVKKANGQIVEYRDVDVVIAEGEGDQVAPCDRCGVIEIAELLTRHPHGRYCDPCNGEMTPR